MHTSITETNSIELIDTTEMMDYLRAPSEDETIVRALVKAAGAAFERYTNGNLLGSTEYETYFDSEECYHAKLELPARPIISVDSVSWIDEAGTETAITDYLWLTGSHMIYRQGGWNFGAQRDFAGLKIAYTAGRAIMPADITAGLQAYVAWQYENRGDVNAELPEIVMTYWAPYVIRRMTF